MAPAQQSGCVSPDLLRYTAFASAPGGGNPAGIVLDATELDATDMQRIASEVGYSETAFLVPVPRRNRRYQVRYFSPLAEVAFCGHATIATAVALAERIGPGPLLFSTRSGDVDVDTALTPGGPPTASLTSVPTRSREATPDEVAEALAALRWAASDLDAGHTPHVAFGGVEHLVLAAANRRRLAELDYDFDGLAGVMTRFGWTTLQLVWQADARTYHARNPFPVGGVVEDPATGAAAAALGGYLMATGRITEPATVTIRQGE
ncbi:MAG: PhzF family phenazine biosynthesis isomerase, partial [Kutzneria sp.]|nr:PhzF family phenazine biosynthesis isomerase [Kutzneria sp.]